MSQSGTTDSGNIIIQNGVYSINNSSITNNIYFYATSGGTPVLKTTSGNLALSNALYLITNGTIDTNSYNLTTNGVISGPGSLTIINTGGANAGALFLNAVNTYKGGTVLNSGKIGIFAASALGSGAITLNAGTILATSDLSLTQNINLTANSTLDTKGYAVKASGNISGNYQLKIKDGSGNNTGSLTLLGTNSGSGSTAVNSGTLKISAANNLGSGTITLAGGTLQVLRALTLTQNMSVTAASTLDTNGYEVTFSGAITGTDLLSIIDSSSTGLGSCSFPGTNSGGVNISSGTVKVSSSSDIGSDITLGGGKLQATHDLTMSHNINLAADSIIDTKGHAIILSGAIALSDNNLNIINGGSVTAGNITATGSIAHQINVSGGCTFTPSGTYTDNDSASDKINIAGPGTTLVLSGSGHVPPTVTLGTGTTLRASGTISSNLVFS